MTYNKNGIPLNRRKTIAVVNTKNEIDKDAIYEFSLPPGYIKKYNLSEHIGNAFAIVHSYDQDYLYVKGTDSSKVNRQLQQICGKRLKYACTTVPAKKGA